MSDLGADGDLPETGRPHVRRRKTIMDYVIMVSGLSGAIAGLSVATGAATDALPFVQKAPYAKDWAVNDLRVQKTESQVQLLSSELSTIQRNGLMTLQLQLQARAESLKTALKDIPQNSPMYFDLRSTHSETLQQLEDIKRQLNR